MTDAQREECDDIITTATLAAGGVGLSPIPGSDSVPLIAIQAAMILKLSGVFDLTFTEANATNLAKTYFAQKFGHYAASQLVGMIPIFGSVIKGGVAAKVTESLGWQVARDFDKQSS